jgi:hypothetical protein
MYHDWFAAASVPPGVRLRYPTEIVLCLLPPPVVCYANALAGDQPERKQPVSGLPRLQGITIPDK